MKTPKVKKREVSIHSRAARRGAIPEPKTSATKPIAEETDYKLWLHSTQNAGISKKKKTKSLTRQQKQRQQRGLEHAERNSDKHEKKVADSKRRSRKIQERTVGWEELNGKIVVREKENQRAVEEATGREKSEVEVMKDAATGYVELPLPVQVADLAEEAEKLAVVAMGDVKDSSKEHVARDAVEDVDEVT